MELSVNNETEYRSLMNNENYIRVGNPSILSEGTGNTFIGGSGISDFYNILRIEKGQGGLLYMN